MNEFVATVIGEVNAALKKKGWKKRGRAPSIEAIVEKTTELLRVATDKELAAAYGDDGKKYKRGEGALDHTGDFSRTDRRSRALCLDRAFPRSMTRQPPSYVDLGHLPRRAGGPEGRRPDQCGNQPLREPRGHGLISHWSSGPTSLWRR